MFGFEIIVVASFILIVVLLVTYVGKIEDETQLLLRTHEKLMEEEGIQSFFEPLTWEERNVIVQNHIKGLRDSQNRLLKTWIAKYFIDYREKIRKLQAQLDERRQMVGSDGSEPLSFSTLNLIQIYASPRIDKEALLEFGFVLDEHFSDSEIEFLLVDVMNQNPHLMTVDISCQELDEEQQGCFRDFFHEVSRTVFPEEQFELQINCSMGSEKSYRIRK